MYNSSEEEESNRVEHSKHSERMKFPFSSTTSSAYERARAKRGKRKGKSRRGGGDLTVCTSDIHSHRWLYIDRYIWNRRGMGKGKVHESSNCILAAPGSRTI